MRWKYGATGSSPAGTRRWKPDGLGLWVPAAQPATHRALQEGELIAFEEGREPSLLHGRSILDVAALSDVNRRGALWMGSEHPTDGQSILGVTSTTQRDAIGLTSHVELVATHARHVADIRCRRKIDGSPGVCRRGGCEPNAKRGLAEVRLSLCSAGQGQVPLEADHSYRRVQAFVHN